MFDHVTIRVKEIGKAKRFYAEALAPLGYRVLYEAASTIGLGDGDEPTIWIAREDPVTSGLHLAFTTGERDRVGVFHAAAVAAGGRDNGAPGPRPDYGPTWYAAFVLDPDGNNIEAVCHKAG